MTKYPKTWGEMTEVERLRLKVAKYEGKTIERFCDDMWIEARETVKLHWDGKVLAVTELNIEGTHRITFDLIDGEPDCNSVRMGRIDD